MVHLLGVDATLTPNLRRIRCLFGEVDAIHSWRLGEDRQGWGKTVGEMENWRPQLPIAMEMWMMH